jgi:hypothetical protein
MIRGVFTLVVAMSLLVCGATAALWTRSFRGGDAAEFQRRDGRWAVVSERGRLVLTNGPQIKLESEQHYREMSRLAQQCLDLEATASILRRRMRGAEGERTESVRLQASQLSAAAEANRQDRAAIMRRPPSTTTLVEVSAPHAVAVAVAAVLPAFWLLATVRGRLLRRRRGSKGLCLRCGYDLRATPGVCPECGDAAPVTPKAARPRPRARCSGGPGTR